MKIILTTLIKMHQTNLTSKHYENFFFTHLKILPTHYQNEYGITMIEVMVSMFILALGILALLGMQIRSLGSIKQAENIVLVSQAVNNLAQGMSINPYLKIKLTSKGYLTEKDYSDYQKFVNCSNRGANFININSQLNKSKFAVQQLNQFCQEISQISGINPADIQLKICSKSSVVGNLNWNFNCSPKGTETVIKVVWKYQTHIEKQNDLNQSGVIDSDNKVILSYEIPLTE